MFQLIKAGSDICAGENNVSKTRDSFRDSLSLCMRSPFTRGLNPEFRKLAGHGSELCESFGSNPTRLLMWAIRQLTKFLKHRNSHNVEQTQNWREQLSGTFILLQRRMHVPLALKKHAGVLSI